MLIPAIRHSEPETPFLRLFRFMMFLYFKFLYEKRLTLFTANQIFRVKRKIITYTFLIYVNGSSTLAFGALLNHFKHQLHRLSCRQAVKSVIYT